MEDWVRHANRARDYADALVEVWSTIPIGTAVVVRRDNGSEFRTVTRSKPWILSGTPVAMVDGISGCYALNRIRPVSANE